jgi:hypothetical protein
MHISPKMRDDLRYPSIIPPAYLGTRRDIFCSDGKPFELLIILDLLASFAIAPLIGHGAYGL